MVSTDFKNARQEPKKGVNEAECQTLAGQLVQLIVTGSDVIESFREITPISTDLQEYLDAITNLKEGHLADETGALKPQLDFYLQLESACQSYSDKPKLWMDALGLIVELAFLLLMRKKYPNSETKVYHEHTVEIMIAGNKFTMVPKPIDVIMWSDPAEQGEFLEIKKDLDAKIEPVEGERADAFISKVGRMYDLLVFLAENGMEKTPVGLATLSSNPGATYLIEITLRAAGKLDVGASLASLQHQLTVITSANLMDWYSRKVV